MTMTRLSRRFAVALVMAIGVASWQATPAASWIQGGITWYANPSGSNVNDCFGNCGAGCSDNVNPCGGPSQYWDLTYVAGPDQVGTSYDYFCVDGTLWEYDYADFQAIGTWTYHGYVTNGCISHDGWCNQWLIGCVAFFGCDNPGWNGTWSYNEWMQGRQVTQVTEIGPCD